MTRDGELTFSNEQADLGVDDLLDSVSLASHEAQDGQEGLDVAEAALLVLQLLLLGRLVDAGEHVGLGVAEHVEQRLILRVLPQHLETAHTVTLPHRPGSGCPQPVPALTLLLSPTISPSAHSRAQPKLLTALLDLQSQAAPQPSLVAPARAELLGRFICRCL